MGSRMDPEPNFLSLPIFPMFSEVRAIYFDLDDTLCGYWTASRKGLVETFSEYGPHILSPEQMVQEWAAAYRGFGPNLKATGWYDRYLTSGEPTRTEQMRLTLLRVGIDDPQLARQLGDAYNEARDRNLQLFPDAIAVLDTLKTKYPMGLITNGPAENQRREVATLGISRYFDPILIEGELREGKPLASVFDKAAKAMDCEPHQLLFVGNSFNHDIAPAIEYGWRTVWVRRATDVAPSSNPDTAKPEEMPIGAKPPDAVIGELSELLALLPPMA